MEALAVVEAGGGLPLANLIATEGVRLNRNGYGDCVQRLSPAWGIADCNRFSVGVLIVWRLSTPLPSILNQ